MENKNNVERIVNDLKQGKPLNREDFKTISKETNWDQYAQKTIKEIQEAADTHYRAQISSYNKGHCRVFI